MCRHRRAQLPDQGGTPPRTGTRPVLRALPVPGIGPRGVLRQVCHSWAGRQSWCGSEHGGSGAEKLGERSGGQTQSNAEGDTRDERTDDRRAAFRRRSARHGCHPQRCSGSDRRTAHPAFPHRCHHARSHTMTVDLPMNGTPAGAHRVARSLAPVRLAAQAASLFEEGCRLGLVAGHVDGDTLRVVYLFLAGAPDRRVELEITLPADDPQLPSLASLSFPASRFEREMHDLYGIVPVKHPLPRRLVRHAHWPAGWYPMRNEAGPPPPFTDTEAYPFLEVTGDGVYEIPVGPVHAGVIEPGHFRLSVVGESILKLKARLWFTHRGVEKLFEGQDATGAIQLAERISGDTSAAHGLAHSLAVEDALGIVMPEPAHRLRALVLELERLYNHAADLGALANDTGFSLANAHAQRIREQLLRINNATTGHRLLRGAISPGAVELLSLPDPLQLADLADDLAEVAQLTLGNTVVRDRFTGTSALSRDQARDLGCLGYVARASGLATDARLHHPTVEP